MQEITETINITVFSDFDGTIIRKDIGDELFIQCGEFEPWHSMLKSGDMHIKDYWRKVFSTIRIPEGLSDRHSAISPEFFKDFVLQYDIDRYFKVFYDYCQKLGIEVGIISDGYKDYICPVMQELGIVDIDVFANELNYLPDGTVEPHYYGESESCECSWSASCKRNTVLVNTPPDNIIVYIGDGYSDLCGAEHSDIVFAKGKLASYCFEKKIPHYNFQNFFDVYRIFSKLIDLKKYKIRHQAFLKRKKAFECE